MAGMGADLPCQHCRNVFKQWHAIQARLKAAEALMSTFHGYRSAAKELLASRYQDGEVDALSLSNFADQIEIAEQTIGKL
jgi:hypothetical protein